MGEIEAAVRVDAQPSQEDKKAAANVVIYNEGAFEETWKQVYKAWQAAFPAVVKSQADIEASPGTLVVQRAGAGEAELIARLIARLSSGKRQLTPEQVMVNFGDKAYLLLQENGIPCGIVGWQVENLVARIDDVYIDDHLPQEDALSMLLKEAEAAARELQCELTLLFMPLKFQGLQDFHRSLGYSSQPVQSLGVRAWDEAARESSSTETFVLYKQLRNDRVLRPV